MRFGSVCSGIEAASVAWEPMGWRADWLAEIEKFPAAVLAHHWPDVPNHGDMMRLPDMVARGDIPAPDVLVGGTPCQAFSVAGKRGSLADERGALTLAFVELANEIDRRRETNGLRPAVVVWENVPGVLSTKDNAFGCFIAGLAGETVPLIPPGGKWSNAGAVFGPKRAVAWRILDAQYFGVAQRRRRVFVVASARDGFDPCAVLFEQDGLRRDIAPSREAGQGAAADAGSGFTPSSFGAYAEGVGTVRANGGDLGGGSETLAVTFDRQSSAEYGTSPVASTVSARDYKSAADLVLSVHGTQDPIAIRDCALPLGRNNGQENAVAFPIDTMNHLRRGDNHSFGDFPIGDPSFTLTKNHSHAVGTSHAIRRLTPRECERLQGFPDDHTLIPWRGKTAADGPRYKAIGNSMAVPVMRWIGQRIEQQTKGATP